MSSNAAVAEHHLAPGDPPHIHHMDSDTAYGAAKLGMWLFLATEILLFSVMFCTFAIMRYYHLAEFADASEQLNWKLGCLNTSVLLISSWTAAVAVTKAQQGDNKAVIFNFGVSIFCGFAFLAIKTIEYTSKAQHGMFPVAPWNYEFYEYKNFLGIYYCMTGLHALHVIIGMVVMWWVVSKARHNRFSARYYTPVELAALYWHLVDLIWIYLFPLLYLVG